MRRFNIPIEKKPRVIINTDAKNEVDDQFAIVHAILTESFDLKGFIAAHFGDKKSAHSRQDSMDELCLLLDMMGLTGSVRLKNGADGPLPDEKTPLDSAGARLIIKEALKTRSKFSFHFIQESPAGFSKKNTNLDQDIRLLVLILELTRWVIITIANKQFSKINM